jgi:hypothetical protein
MPNISVVQYFKFCNWFFNKKCNCGRNMWFKEDNKSRRCSQTLPVFLQAVVFIATLTFVPNTNHDSTCKEFPHTFLRDSQMV